MRKVKVIGNELYWQRNQKRYLLYCNITYEIYFKYIYIYIIYIKQKYKTNIIIMHIDSGKIK